MSIILILNLRVNILSSNVVSPDRRQLKERMGLIVRAKEG